MGHMAHMGEKRNSYRDLMVKSEGRDHSEDVGVDEQRPCGRPRHRWENNVEIDVKEIGWEGMDWIELVQDRDKCKAFVNR